MSKDLSYLVMLSGMVVSAFLLLRAWSAWRSSSVDALARADRFVLVALVALAVITPALAWNGQGLDGRMLLSLLGPFAAIAMAERTFFNPAARVSGMEAFGRFWIACISVLLVWPLVLKHWDLWVSWKRFDSAARRGAETVVLMLAVFYLSHALVSLLRQRLLPDRVFSEGGHLWGRRLLVAWPWLGNGVFLALVAWKLGRLGELPIGWESTLNMNVDGSFYSLYTERFIKSSLQIPRIAILSWAILATLLRPWMSLREAFKICLFAALGFLLGHLLLLDAVALLAKLFAPK